MQLNDLVEKIPFLNRVNTLLVCEIDHLGLRVAAMQRHGEHLTISHEAHSDAPELSTAVAEVVTHVCQQGWVGKHAVLLTPAVLQSLIDLPIPPKNKLAPQQIAEQVYWELAPLLMQHHKSYSSIGRIMLAHGYISEEQIDDVLSQQNHYEGGVSMAAAKEFNNKRFGEIALQLGYVEQNQLNRCLAKQSWVMAAGEAVQCGWSAQGKSPNDEAGGMHYQWLASAVNQSLLRQWQAAFSAQNVKLEALYPLSDNAIGTVALDSKSKKHQLLIEVHDSMLTGLHFVGQQLCQLHTLPNTPERTTANCTEIYHLLANTEMDTVWLADSSSKNEVESHQLIKLLNQALPQPVKPISKPTETISLGMLGAARHFMHMHGASTIAGVAVNEPLPPLLQRVEIRALLAGMGLLLALGVAEVVLQVRHGLIAYESEKISADLKKIESAIARINAKVDEVKKLKESIKDKQAEIKELDSSVKLISVDLPKRNQTINNFLNELNRTVSEDVVIDSIAEDTIMGFSIGAWAINEKSAQEFAKNLQIAIHPLGYKLKDITVTEQTGRLGLLGSAINFNATALSDEAWKNAKLINPQVQSGTTSAGANNAAKGGQ